MLVKLVAKVGGKEQEKWQSGQGIMVETVAVKDVSEASGKGGRKRTRKMAKWARNVQKFKRARGETYTHIYLNRKIGVRKKARH
ncbi:hypothetical protein QE152_g23431 [Popillia japonica]|uniref:Uncharacterized protein n=1 Tax=Popillia japonica TaxID=7064 RepID=A0AAW1KID1_POPJA